MNRNEAIAFIRSRHNKIYATSHEMRVMEDISKEPYFDELRPMLVEYCEPLIFHKNRLVEYTSLMRMQTPAVNGLSHFGRTVYFGGDQESKGWHVEELELVQDFISVTLYDNYWRKKKDGSYGYTDANLDPGLLKLIESSTVLKAICFDFRDWKAGTRCDLSNVKTLKYAFNIPYYPFLNGDIKLPDTLLYLGFGPSIGEPDLTKLDPNVAEMLRVHKTGAAASPSFRDTMKGLYQSFIADFVGKPLTKSQIKNLSPSVASGGGTELFCHSLAMSHRGMIHMPNLLGYSGMIELLDKETMANIRMWQPKGGLWSLNKDRYNSPIKANELNPHIENIVVPNCPRLKGIAFYDGMTMNGKNEERYGHISSVGKVNMEQNGIYFMEMFGG